MTKGENTTAIGPGIRYPPGGLVDRANPEYRLELWHHFFPQLCPRLGHSPKERLRIGGRQASLSGRLAALFELDEQPIALRVCANRDLHPVVRGHRSFLLTSHNSSSSAAITAGEAQGQVMHIPGPYAVADLEL